MAIPDQSATACLRRRLLRISLRALFIVVTLCCVGAWWWWQVPYRVETPTKVFAGKLDGRRQYEQGRQVESFRREGFGDSFNHGPKREYDADGNLIFEEHWQNGVRHGLYRKWDEVSGEQIIELDKKIQQEEKISRHLRLEIDSIKSDPKTVERLAREQLGLARPGETVVRFVGAGG